LSKKSSYHLTEHFVEPLSLGFLRSVSLFPESNVLFVDEKQYTYRQLWQIVDEIYHQLPTDKLHTAIGIYCNNDVFTYASIIAVNLYGAAYVPLNNKSPAIKNLTFCVH